jgi:formamidopyrimidine-DNA glycosylase
MKFMVRRRAAPRQRFHHPAAHGKYGKPCPICATSVRRIRRAENDSNYCARSQTGGKIIADGGFSQLLKADRPRTLDAEATARKTQRRV